MKRSPQIRSAGRRGFSLTELLMCLSMMGVAGLIAIRLFDQSMHVVQASAQDPTFQLDQMAQMLRIDVWSAKEIKITSGKTADLTMRDGKQIRWQWDPQRITRSEIAGAATTNTRHWTTTVQFTAERADHALVLRAYTDQWRFTAPMASEASP